MNGVDVEALLPSGPALDLDTLCRPAACGAGHGARRADGNLRAVEGTPDVSRRAEPPPTGSAGARLRDRRAGVSDGWQPGQPRGTARGVRSARPRGARRVRRIPERSGRGAARAGRGRSREHVAGAVRSGDCRSHERGPCGRHDCRGRRGGTGTTRRGRARRAGWRRRRPGSGDCAARGRPRPARRRSDGRHDGRPWSASRWLASGWRSPDVYGRVASPAQAA